MIEFPITVPSSAVNLEHRSASWSGMAELAKLTWLNWLIWLKKIQERVIRNKYRLVTFDIRIVGVIDAVGFISMAVVAAAVAVADAITDFRRFSVVANVDAAVVVTVLIVVVVVTTVIVKSIIW